MWKNYLLVALRSLRKQKGYAAINVLGLAIGVGGCLLVSLLVRQELAFDRFHENADRIYRAWVLEDYGPDESFHNTVTPYVLAPTLASTYPEIEAATRFRRVGGAVRQGDQVLAQTFSVVDTTFFDVFSFGLLQGEEATALARPDALVLTDSAALRHFGTTDVLGQVVTAQLGSEERQLVVTAIAESPPETTSLPFSALVSSAQNQGLVSEEAQQSWTYVTPETYVLLREGASAAALEAKFPQMMATALGPDFPGEYTVGLQPLLDVHLDPDMPEGIAYVVDPEFLVILSVIALLVLLIACVNFTTLALGRSVERTREVGVRKALGAQRAQLMGQFWGEAALTTGLALVVGIVLAVAFHPTFNEWTDLNLALRLDLGTLLVALGLALVVALVAGSYPALVLSRARPAEVLRGRLGLNSGATPQRALVALQFACSIALLASALVMSQQFEYLRTKSLGYEPDRIVTLWDAAPFDAGLEGVAPVLDALERESAVSDVSVSAFALGGWGGLGYNDEADRYRTFGFNVVAPDYLEAMQIGLAAGPGFAAEPGLAASQAVVNEAFAEAYGLEDPVGRPLPDPLGDYVVAGVTEDFHYASLREVVEPLVLVTSADSLFGAVENVNLASSPALDVVVRLGAGPLPEAMEALERAFTHAAPEAAFDYTFLYDALDQQYEAERSLSEAVRFATGLAVLIACLGLFGLATLIVAQRTKEVGVRKVLGASVGSIVVLLGKDFARLVLLAFVVAAPLAYVLMGRWLESYAYRIELGVGFFLVAGVAALLVALLTVSVHAIRAATADPVRALRSE